MLLSESSSHVNPAHILSFMVVLSERIVCPDVLLNHVAMKRPAICKLVMGLTHYLRVGGWFVERNAKCIVSNRADMLRQRRGLVCREKCKIHSQ